MREGNTEGKRTPEEREEMNEGENCEGRKRIARREKKARWKDEG